MIKTVKCVIFFASFCWFWDFLLENLKLKKNSDGIHWNVWTNMKPLYARNNIFKKRIPIMIFSIHLYFGPNFVFLRTALGFFRQCFSTSNFSSLANHGDRHFCSVPHHKKASCGPDIVLVVAKNSYSMKDSFFNEGIRRISKSVICK